MSQAIFTRRDALGAAACGFGQLALTGLLNTSASAAPANPLRPRQPHLPPRAKRIIFLFMQGGPSHVDSFDYKPVLEKRDGETLPFDDARVIAKSGKRGSQQLLKKPLWKFRQYGESGRWVSDLFPETARHSDKLCLLHSMHTEGVAHGPATLFLHCGSTNFVRPSMGAWINYGLGSENENLPGFVSICPSPGNGGARNYGSAFLPPVFQGTAMGTAGGPTADAKIRDLVNARLPRQQQRQQFNLLRSLNNGQLPPGTRDTELEAVINSFELAWRMQSHAPDVLDLSRETAATQALYGINQPQTANFGRQCLMARRLSEAGVRFIQVTYGDGSPNPAWDQHSNLPKHAEHARRVDKPIAGLLEDLQQRGLLEDTIVWWGAEFGRTPYAQDRGTGRDHNPDGFTVWLAGGGLKPAFAYGNTDEFGHVAVEKKMHMHDLHATLLHLLGIDHLRLTYRHSGRDFRLTDVHGEVVHELFS